MGVHQNQTIINVVLSFILEKLILTFRLHLTSNRGVTNP